MRALAKKLGANYAWGLINFTLGVVAASFWVGLIVGAFGHVPHC
jgi:hypothetical protein